MKTRKLITMVLTLSMLAMLLCSFSVNAAEPAPISEGIQLKVSAERYQASKAFTLEKNQNQNWSWDAYAVKGYKSTMIGDIEKGAYHHILFPFTDVFGSGTYPAPEKASTGGFVLFNTASLVANTGGRIGQYWMRQGNSKTVIENFYMARSFTAPKAGTVVIQADYLGESKILAVNSANADDAQNQRGVRLMKQSGEERTQLWPVKGDATQTQSFDGALWAVVPKGQTIEFPPLTEKVKEGDSLHFELANINFVDSVDSRNYVAVYWDPVISYDAGLDMSITAPTSLDEVPVDQEFRISCEPSLTSFDDKNVEIDNGASVAEAKDDNGDLVLKFDGLKTGKTYTVTLKDLKTDNAQTPAATTFRFTTPSRYQASQAGYEINPSWPWAWQRYDIQNGKYENLYTRLDKKFTDPNSYPSPADSLSEGVPAFQHTTGNSATVGRYYMNAEMEVAIKGTEAGAQTVTQTIDKYYTVRTFTAPKTGSVRISAADINGDSKIASAKSSNAVPGAETNLRGVRILKESGGTVTQLWPTDANKGDLGTGTVHESDFALVPAQGDIAFPTLYETLKQGDMLHFELANVNPEGTYEGGDGKLYTTGGYWGVSVYWDPVITYEKALAVGTPAFNNGRDLTTAQAVIGSAEAVTVTVPVTASMIEVDKLVAIAAVYNKQGTMLGCGITNEENGLTMNQQKNLTITIPAINMEDTDGYVKVFLWDSFAEMTPLSTIGENPVLGSSDIE